jgi:hypothetical protein
MPMNLFVNSKMDGDTINLGVIIEDSSMHIYTHTSALYIGEKREAESER